MIRLLLIFLLCGAVGWTCAGFNEPALLKAAAAVGAPAGRHAEGKPMALRTPQDFQVWARERAPAMLCSAPRFQSHDGELADWSETELKAALEQGLRDPAVVLYGPEMRALYALMLEWSKRRPDEAWAWIQQLPAGPMRLRLAGALTEAWPPARAEEAMEMVCQHRDDFESPDSYNYREVLRHAFESAAARGPQAVDELLGKLREKGLQYPHEGLKFPAGFDFAGWARSPELSAFLKKRPDRSFFVDAWMNQSPEEAFTGVLALNRESGDQLGSGLFEGLHRINQKEPEVMADRARRIVAVMAGLSVEEQQQLAEAGAKALTEDPPTLRAYFEALPDSEMRSEASRSAAAVLLRSDPREALDFIEIASAPSGRLGMLESLLDATQGGRATFMAGDVAASLQNKLAAWGASPEQAEALRVKIQRFRE